ncbi:MAG: CGNR zinc finger domain-containing protein [Rhodobacteraceae bacterium]|jgi:hypothetical protein|nr:CGNR zinc finger domain-containing protein [Paracoccaceae bacterium]
MTYSTNSQVKLVAGRLALDFVNTADWTDDGALLKDRIASLADLAVWQDRVGLPDAHWDGTLDQLRDFRHQLRRAVLGQATSGLTVALEGTTAPSVDWLRRQSLRSLISISALSVLADPRELDRVKLCQGHDCGWIFLDETKNARRKWCLMEVCGNRAKSTRHYARKLEALR